MRAEGFDANHPIDIAVVNGRNIILDGHHRALPGPRASMKGADPSRRRRIS
jgi:filamentous hemagglutinin